ncbi:uncharacterized protein LOC143263948 isoform X2 [Megachile rotundata]|uniref:uncharacterized protein LOC143263948 isoform X2 n=1 Tax=Megachile rotundata TaxID=143995 RepID=UPI003FD4B35E
MNRTCAENSCTRTISTKEYTMKINDIRDTVRFLEESLMVSRSLEAEQWLCYSKLKTKNKVTTDDLKKANNRNKNMLNLFRQSVTDIRLGSGIALPESLRREVQKNWHQKYDALLKRNEQLKREVTLANSLIKEKTQEVHLFID